MLIIDIFFYLFIYNYVFNWVFPLPGDVYQNGTSFCEAQNFHVIDGKQNCFKFDPGVFDLANTISGSGLLVLVLSFITLGFQ